MVLSFEPPDARFIAYIDESGDPGLSRVRPLDAQGSSEWLVLGAIVARLTNEPGLVGAVKGIRAAIESRQGPTLHYRQLSQERKSIVCTKLARLPVRCFAFLSNKKNMKGYKNLRAEAARGASTQEYFYNFCVRVLLERVTEFVEEVSVKDYGAPKHLEIVFSERGGLRYSQTIAYLDLLRQQARSETTFLDTRVIRWQVVHPKLIRSIPHTKSAGAQLADTVASAFFQSVNTSGVGMWDTEQAKLLKPRMWEKNGVFADNGMTLFPTPPRKAKLTEKQEEIFRFYGYRF